MSQSTYYFYPTALKLASFMSIFRLVDAMGYLRAAFQRKAEEFRNVLKMGRTQLQDAVPMTLGQEFKAFGALMRHEISRLSRAAELLLEVNLGATAIGTGLNTPDGYSACAVAK